MRTIVLLIALAATSAAETFTYWIEPCTKPEAECEATDEQLAEWALDAWATGVEWESRLCSFPVEQGSDPAVLGGSTGIAVCTERLARSR